MDNEESSLATLSGSEKEFQPVRVMHVDDDPDLRLLISASLQNFGYFVATAGSVAEGLQLAGEFRFDLFILDVRLPDGTLGCCMRSSPSTEDLSFLPEGSPVSANRT